MANTKPIMQYFRDGKAIVNPSVNSLSGFAYFYTKGIDDLPRITTKRLEELLAEAGVAEPRSTEFEVTLPNGRVIAAKITGHKEAPEPKAPKAVEAESEAKATTIARMKKAGERLKAVGRHSGANKITVTRGNFEALLAATDAELEGWPSDPKPKPAAKPTAKKATPKKEAASA